MPSTGTPSSSTAGSSEGAPGALTEAGPPDRINACGSRRRSSSIGVSWGRSSEKTRHSRTRRAISCEYWAPKSRTITGRSPAWAADWRLASISALGRLTHGILPLTSVAGRAMVGTPGGSGGSHDGRHDATSETGGAGDGAARPVGGTGGAGTGTAGGPDQLPPLDL